MKMGRDNTAVRARDAGALDRGRAGAEDQAHAAQREGTARASVSSPICCCAAPSARLPHDMKEKIALFCDVDVEAVITASDVHSVYEVPLVFAEQGVDEIILRLLHMDARPARSEPLDRHAGADAESRRPGGHRARRQICRVRGFLQEPEGSPAARRPGAPAEGEHPLDRIRATCSWPDCARRAGTIRRHSGAGRIRQARRGGHDSTPFATRAKTKCLISASVWECKPW